MQFFDWWKKCCYILASKFCGGKNLAIHIERIVIVYKHNLDKCPACGKDDATISLHNYGVCAACLHNFTEKIPEKYCLAVARMLLFLERARGNKAIQIEAD